MSHVSVRPAAGRRCAARDLHRRAAAGPHAALLRGAAAGARAGRARGRARADALPAGGLPEAQVPARIPRRSAEHGTQAQLMARDMRSACASAFQKWRRQDAGAGVGPQPHAGRRWRLPSAHTVEACSRRLSGQRRNYPSTAVLGFAQLWHAQASQAPWRQPGAGRRPHARPPKRAPRAGTPRSWAA